MRFLAFARLSSFLSPVEDPAALTEKARKWVMDKSLSSFSEIPGGRNGWF